MISFPTRPAGISSVTPKGFPRPRSWSTAFVTKNALAVRHLAFEDLGLLQRLLTNRGYDVRYLDAGVDSLDPGTLAAADLLVVLGGPIGVHDTDQYPVLAEEVAALRLRVNADRPTLGICLGAQLLALALGANVAPTGRTEIGYASLTLTPAGLASPLRHLDGVPVLHWHEDRFGIPEGAEHLAATGVCDHQAFSAGPRQLGLQFHVEADYRRIDQWLIGHAGALAAAGIRPADLRRDAAVHGPALAEAATRVIEEWLSGAERP